MQSQHDRAKETAELMERFRVAAARRRRQQLILASAIAAIALGTVVAALTLTLSGPEATPADSTSTTDEAAIAAVPMSSTTQATPTSVLSATLSTTTSTTIQTQTSSATVADKYVVVLDPGHQAKADTAQEPIGPGSSETKARVSSGTKSINTGAPESELVLEVALKLRDSLLANGIEVIMTRTTQEVWISNMERAQVANAANADLFVRIHADGAADTSIHGVLLLYPAAIEGWTDDIAVDSKRAARLALDHMVASTGAKNRGMVARENITGFNWSDVPVILPEIGLMTNSREDALLATDEYQDKIVQGLTNAILEFLGVR